MTGRAVGVDLSPEMVRRARELAGQLPRVEFVVGDSGYVIVSARRAAWKP